MRLYSITPRTVNWCRDDETRWPVNSASAANASAKLIVGAAIVDDLAAPSRILVGRRSAPEALAGMWEFPGGKVEPGEEALAALHRELLEELGITVRAGAELAAPELPAWPLAGTAVMRVWFVQIESGVPTALEDHDELRWLDLADPEPLRALPWIPADGPIVAELIRLTRG